LKIEAKMIKIIVLSLLVTLHLSAKAQVYSGKGESFIVNITPEQAKQDARDLAHLDIIQQVTGIEISSRQLLVNSTMASYHILQSRRARVVNSDCDYQITQDDGALKQTAQCQGEVQVFGREAPEISASLIAMDNRKVCDYSISEFNSAETDALLFKSGQRFCLLLNAREPLYASVFAMYEQGGTTKISRLFPEDNQALLHVRSGRIPQLTALASEPLPGQLLSQEALLILASREPLIGEALLDNISGFDAAQTIGDSVDMAQFDRSLGKLNLDKIEILVLPYAIKVSR